MSKMILLPTLINVNQRMMSQENNYVFLLSHLINTHIVRYTIGLFGIKLCELMSQILKNNITIFPYINTLSDTDAYTWENAMYIHEYNVFHFSNQSSTSTSSSLLL